jgi:DNA-binding winged helix-turn-helix (wHTH) protein/tetratricopeptide (TPR) repeat protein
MPDIGPFKIDPVALRIFRSEQRIELRPKAVELLLLLASRPGETFTKQQLLTQLWPRRTVEEKNLVILVGTIRRRLQPFLSTAEAIITLPTHGYRLGLPVRQKQRIYALSPPAVLTVRVQPLANLSDDSISKQTARSLTYALTTQLAQTPQIQITQQSSADLLVSGSVMSLNKTVRCHIHVSDEEHQQLLWAQQHTGTIEELFALEDSASKRLCRKLAQFQHNGRFYNESVETADLKLRHCYRLGQHWLWQRTAASLQQAQKVFKKLLQQDADCHIAHTGLAQSYAIEAYYLTADPQKSAHLALKHAQHALLNNPRNASAHAARGFAFLNLFNHSAAAAAFDAALDSDPFNIDALHWYAEYQMCNGQLDKATTTLQSALVMEPESAVLNSDLGKLLMFKRAWSEAAKQFAIATELEPEFCMARLRLAFALFAQRQTAAALEVLEQVRSTALQTPLHAALLGACNALCGRPALAESFARQIDSHAQRHASAHYGLALLMLSLNRQEQSLNLLKSAIAQRAPLSIYTPIDPLLDPLSKLVDFELHTLR